MENYKLSFYRNEKKYIENLLGARRNILLIEYIGFLFYISRSQRETYNLQQIMMCIYNIRYSH